MKQLVIFGKSQNSVKKCQYDDIVGSKHRAKAKPEMEMLIMILSIFTNESVTDSPLRKILETTDYEHTMAKSLILCCQNSNPKYLYGIGI